MNSCLEWGAKLEILQSESPTIFRSSDSDAIDATALVSGKSLLLDIVNFMFLYFASSEDQ